MRKAGGQIEQSVIVRDAASFADRGCHPRLSFFKRTGIGQAERVVKRPT